MKIKALIKNMNYEQKNNNCESCNIMLSNEEIRKLVVATIDEIEKEKNEKIEEQEKLKKTIINAIIEAEKQKNVMESEEFKNKKLKGKDKFWCGICIAIAVVFFVIAIGGAILSGMGLFEMEIIKCLSLILPGMIFIILKYNIVVMCKSSNIGLRLTMYSVTIAISSLVFALLDIVFSE